MGILAAYPTQRELPLSNQTRFSYTDDLNLVPAGEIIGRCSDCIQGPATAFHRVA